MLYDDDIMIFATANEKSALTIRESTQHIGMVVGLHIKYLGYHFLHITRTIQKVLAYFRKL